jgi:uncharacterized protein involved in exopolysaccharide biosynthesis
VNIDFHFYWKLLLRRFPVMALLFMISLGLAYLFATRLPETYSTSARLLVEAPQIPDSMVESTVRTDAVEQLDIIQQRLLTRANLIDIANRFDVFTDLRTVEPDIIVQRMQRQTRIRRSSGRNQATLMTITFEGRDSQVVANVVNEYVTLVLEANMSFRLGRAENTLDFFEQEVERLASELDSQSIQIAAFRSENAKALPEDQQYRLSRQALLQERLSLLERDLRNTQSERKEIVRIFETTGRLNQPTTFQNMTREQQELVAARADLERALSTYSPENPRVMRMQNVVDRLEAIVAAQTAAVGEGTEEGGATTPEQAMFQATVLQLDNQIENLTGEIQRTLEELEELQANIVASAANRQEIEAMERDYEIIQSRYNSAVANLNEARMSERIETTAQGQRITVIENANVPRLPSGPNRGRIIALGGVLGIALAVGFFLLLEVFNRNIRRPAELVAKFNIKPIATIPYIESKAQETARRVGLILGSLVALVGTPLLLWYIDKTYMPMDLLVRNVLSRLGFI